MGYCGTSAKTPFVVTPSGSCQLKMRHRTGCSARPMSNPSCRPCPWTLYIYIYIYIYINNCITLAMPHHAISQHGTAHSTTQPAHCTTLYLTMLRYWAVYLHTIYLYTVYLYTRRPVYHLPVYPYTCIPAYLHTCMPACLHACVLVCYATPRHATPRRAAPRRAMPCHAIHPYIYSTHAPIAYRASQVARRAHSRKRRRRPRPTLTS